MALCHWPNHCGLPFCHPHNCGSHWSTQSALPLCSGAMAWGGHTGLLQPCCHHYSNGILHGSHQRRSIPTPELILSMFSLVTDSHVNCFCLLAGWLCLHSLQLGNLDYVRIIPFFVITCKVKNCFSRVLSELFAGKICLPNF